MKMNLTRYMQNVTGSAIVFGMREEFTGRASSLAFEEDVGCLDAPNIMSAGSCRDYDGIRVMLSAVYRR